MNDRKKLKKPKLHTLKREMNLAKPIKRWGVGGRGEREPKLPMSEVKKGCHYRPY